MNNNISTDQIIESLKSNLPEVFNRRIESLGIIISARTLANLDSLKKGPPKMYLSKIVVYECDSFLEWLEPRLSVREGEPL
jgi:hypothetical protein